MLRSDLQQQIHIERLGPAHVDHGGIQGLGRLQRGIQQGAKGQNGDARSRRIDLAEPMIMTEIAPGLDLQRDVLAVLGAPVAVAEDLKTMDARIFRDAPMF